MSTKRERRVRYELRGRIAATGFTSGDRVVIGMWDSSPIGPFADVMWAEPDGSRVLYAAPRAAAFITAVYEFDRVVEQAVGATYDGRTLRYRARSVRRVRAVSVRGPRDMGVMASLEPVCGFGFSEPPRFPSITEVRPLLEDHGGRLEAVIAAVS